MATLATTKKPAAGQQRWKNRAGVFKALAHPTRIRVIDALAQREHCVCELVELVGDDPSTISKHLSIMKAAGLVSSDRRGTLVFYSLKMKCVPGFMECVDKAVVESAREQIGLAG
jgi:ArsR family transcriptional regulator